MVPVMSAAQEHQDARRAPVIVALPTTDLEWFWPSRRGHAYDEWCC
jgi:hypothetical protein